MKDNIELILKLFYPTFILLSLAKITAYYNQFHLPILEYINFSEFIVIFLSNIYVYSVLFFHFAILFFWDKKHLLGSLTLIVLAFIFINFFNSLSGNFIFDTSNILLVISAIILLIVIAVLITKTSVTDFLSTLDISLKKTLAGASAILVLLVIASTQGKFEADQVKKEHVFSGTSIKTKSSYTISNDTIYFIGKTNEFVFFYNQKEKSVRVYPINEIEVFNYRANVKY